MFSCRSVCYGWLDDAMMHEVLALWLASCCVLLLLADTNGVILGDQSKAAQAG